MKKTIYLLVLLLLTSILPGCSLDSLKNNLIRSQEDFSNSNIAQTQPESVNPLFSQTEESAVDDLTIHEIDKLVKKALSQVFGGAKIINGKNLQSTPLILEYIPEKLIDRKDGEVLQKAFIDLESRAKEDAPPTFFENRNTVEFSVFHDFGGRSYILGVVLDLGGQKVWVNVY